jgi:serine/threonine protein kinase
MTLVLDLETLRSHHINLGREIRGGDYSCCYLATLSPDSSVSLLSDSGGSPELFMKVIVGFDEDYYNSLEHAFDNESNIFRICGTAGIGPRVVDTFLCKAMYPEEEIVGVVLMEKLDRISTPITGSQKHNLIDQIKRLHELGYVHRDIHSGNVMVDSSTKNLKLIDYGSATLATAELIARDFELIETWFPNTIDG